jgi:plastocyanin
MKKILFIGLVIMAVLTSGCYQPRVNLNTTVQQGGTPAAPEETALVTPTPTPSPTSTPIPTISPAVTAKVVVTAVVQNSEFSPVTLTISEGQTVTWTNMDSVSHTVTSTTGVFDSGPISSGQTFSYTFNNAGTFEYSCTIHPSIPHGKVIVT